jgi:hypothetical protein
MNGALALRPGPRFNGCMAPPELNRRRYREIHDCWHIYYGDVHVGTIARRVGNPHDTDPWEGTAASIRARIPAVEHANPL